MSPFAEMVSGARTCSCLFAYLERGQIANVLGDIELAAARDSFSRIPTAFDKRGQVQICIGHLNSSFSAYTHTIESAGVLDRTLITRSVKLLSAQTKACFVLCVRAICFAYLEESLHCQQDLEMAEKLRTRELVGGASVLWFLSGIVNPVAGADMAYAAFSNLGKPNDDIYETDVELIRKLRSVIVEHTA